MTRWLLWTFLTVLTWGIWAVLSKLLAAEVESPAHGQVISTVGIVPVVLALYLMNETECPQFGRRRRGIWLALGSGIISCLGNIAYFDVFNRGAKAAAVIPITALYPAVTVLLAVLLLKEQLSRLQLMGIGLSLGAIYLFNVPGLQGVSSGWLLFALIPVMLWGVCGLMQKMATDHISARSAAIWFLFSFLPVAAIIVMIDPLPSGLDIRTWALAAAVGFTLAFGNFTFLRAFSTGGKASIITPLAGLYPLVSLPLAMAAFGERIGWRESFGIVCALVAVVLLSYPSTPASQQASTHKTE